jgi:hypothetical protein
MSYIREALHQKRRQQFLRTLVNEAVYQILQEQEAAPAPAGVPAPMTPSPDVSAPPAPEGQPKEFTVDDMIERLNVIRGGRSFTDPEVYGQLVTFFKTQTDEQKTGIEQFLIEIGKIVINVNEQETPASEETSAVPPSTPGTAPTPPAPPPTAPAPPATPAI